MVIKRICYPVRTLGPGERAGVWTAGCSRRCRGCISPELQRAENGREISEERILHAIERVPGQVDGVTISGGEPFDQPAALHRLVALLDGQVTDDILVFTGYTLAELRAKHDPDVDGALSHLAVLVDGPYLEALDDGVGLRGSANQRIHVFRHAERYAGAERQERAVQNISYGSQLLMIGIPPALEERSGEGKTDG